MSQLQFSRYWIGALIYAAMLSAAHAQTSEANPQQPENPPPEMIDDLRDGIKSSVSATAAWLDSFFADEVNPADYGTAYGSLSIRPEWDEYDGFKIDSSFRASVVFPHAERQFSAFIGRGDFDDIINNTQTTRPSVIRRDQSDEEWMVGLGFDPYVEDHHSFSIGAGFRGGIDLDPYVRARYRFETILSDASEIHLQSVGFWRDSDGFGIAQTIEHDQAFGERWFNKFWIRGTFAERTEGIRWHASEKLYFMYHPERAIGGEVWWYGETRNAVPMQDYGLRALHRSRFMRDWLYVESWVGLHWPREFVEESRRPRWLVGIEVEMLFGD